MFAFISRKNRRTPAVHKPQSRFRPRLEALEDRCLLSGGVLDPTFGSGGIVTTTAGGLSIAFAVATYPAGSANAGAVVAVGDAQVGTVNKPQDEPAIVRYNPNGTLDTSFGGTGEVIMNLKSGGVARDVVVQPDSKIVVAYSWGGFDLARYNANGSLDSSFGGQGTGMVSTSIGKFTTDTAYSLALEPSGDIVVAGTVSSSTGANLDVLRYTAGGLLDASFGTGGIATTQLPAPVYAPNYNENWVHLALDTSPSDPNAGDIVVVAELNTTGPPVVVVRYNAGGSLDTSFGGGAGYETLSNVLHPSVAIESNGDIIVAGEGYGNQYGALELDCLNPNGSFNTTFGSGGIAVLNPAPNTYFVARDVTIQADGQIVVAGVYDNENTAISLANFFVARFNSADGSLDSSFGTGGVASASSGSNLLLLGVSLALEPDGRIAVAGTPRNTGGFELARFVAYGPEVSSFIASPNSVAAGSELTLTAGNITDEIPSAAITQVAFYVQINGSNTLLGYGIQSSTGVWTLTFTINLAPGTYTLYAQAKDSYGIIGDLVALTLTVQ